MAGPRVERAWAFTQVRDALEDPARRSKLLAELRRGRKLFCKWFPVGRRPIKFATPTAPSAA